ncbi:MAG: aldehyde dehydrogenase family protein [Planctomycetota bacterium]|jgi:succinylglutamic semialdehyde dehydrogenase
MTDALAHPPSDYLDGAFVPLPGDGVVSTDPDRPDRVIWRGTPRAEHVDRAVTAARAAADAWADRPLDERIELLRRWQQVTREHADRLAGLIADEMGKTLAEARAEAGALASKVDVTLDAVSLGRVRRYDVEVSATRTGHCRFHPHGVMAVIGPFNFPAHLPNGHFVPALLMGNTIVFKPSEKTPAVGQLLAELMHEAGLPPGVFNVVQGPGEIAARLVDHDELDGILFTGSWPVGRRILQANLDRPGRIVALEMGGNNAAVVMPDADLRQAVLECARSAFATAGQRCTCTRRIIVHQAIAGRFLPALGKVASTLLVGSPRSGDPVFMGPLVSGRSVEAVLEFQQSMHEAGARLVVPSVPLDRPGHYLTAGVIEVDRFSLETDCEIFGPLVQVTTVDSLDEAIAQANATRFGLAAAIFTKDDEAWRIFRQRCRCGCINRNTGTAGASSKLPFGGLGHSGNHRPAAAFAADYCAYPVASLEESSSESAPPTGLHWDDAWDSQQATVS